MARRYVFVDESGNLDFSLGGTRYFTLASITLDTCEIGNDLMQLRRDLSSPGLELPTGFHASEDRQVVRDQVFRLIAGHDLRIDATIFEMPQPRGEGLRFYKSARYYHMKHVLPIVAHPGDDLVVIGAALSLKKRQQYAHEAIAEVVGTTAGATPFKTAAWAAASEPCLQVADYCCWAIQRKWEREDDRSHRLIAEKIGSEFDIFRWGTQRYY